MSRPARSPEARRRALRAGRLAETAALLFLIAKGYRVLARRYAAAGGEIDLVMRRGALVAFVEVKGRRDIGAAETAVTGEKRRRLARAIGHWRTGRDTAGLSLRADAVYCAPWRWPRHVEGIFEIDGRG